jgi:hypothetical protein
MAHLFAIVSQSSLQSSLTTPHRTCLRVLFFVGSRRKPSNRIDQHDWSIKRPNAGIRKLRAERIVSLNAHHHYRDIRSDRLHRPRQPDTFRGRYRVPKDYDIEILLLKSP